MSKWNLGWLVGMAMVAALGLSLTYSAPTLKNKHENLKLVVDVMDLVRENYVKELTPEKERQFIEDSINGGLEKLDPYSGFMGADEYKQFTKQSRGTFGGIGVRISIEQGRVYVESPMVDTPAYNAGVLAGDIITKIDGEPTENMNMKKVVDKIQGEPGTKVKITVLHEGAKDIKEAVDLEITRDVINIDSVLGDNRIVKNKLAEWNYWVDPASKIGYVRITAFTEKTAGELTKVVAYLQSQKMEGLVVDLRGNPGGLLSAAVEVSSVFLPEGQKIVTTKGRGNAGEKSYFSQHKNLNIKPQVDYPLVILINHGSASASEIVAAALQDHLRAVIMGERSFGKGSVQNVIPMENNTTALKLTTASYWRPSGKNIHRFPDSKEKDEWGVMPDKGYVIDLTPEERVQYLKYRRDRDIIRVHPDPKKDKDAKPFKDRVLEKAVEYINGKLKDKGQGKNAQNKQPAQPPRPVQAVDDPFDNLGAVSPSPQGRFAVPVLLEERWTVAI